MIKNLLRFRNIHQKIIKLYYDFKALWANFYIIKILYKNAFLNKLWIIDIYGSHPAITLDLS